MSTTVCWRNETTRIENASFALLLHSEGRIHPPCHQTQSFQPNTQDAYVYYHHSASAKLPPSGT